jgi:hypothetical protein
VPAGDEDLVLAHEWIVSLWVSRSADSAEVLGLVAETETALAVVVGDLSRKTARDEGLPLRVEVDP